MKFLVEKQTSQRLVILLIASFEDRFKTFISTEQSKNIITAIA